MSEKSILIRRSDGQTHPLITMKGTKQVSTNLENELVRAYLANATYDSSWLNNNSTTAPKVSLITPYYYCKAYRLGANQTQNKNKSAFSEIGRPIIICGTNAGDSITIKSGNKHEVTVVGTKGATLVYNLIPGLSYTYTVKRNNNTVKTGSFATEGQCRMIKCSIPNFRDIGGWSINSTQRISYNKIFRGCGFIYHWQYYDNGQTGTKAFKDYTWVAGSLHAYNRPNPFKTTDTIYADTDIIDELLNIGITLDLDVRASGSGNQDYSYAVNPNYNSYTKSYNKIKYSNRAILAYNTENPDILYALQDIATELKNGGKVWLHCATGADRTGVLTAVIQALCGCSIDSIIKEYELTLFNGNGYGGFKTIKINNEDVLVKDITFIDSYGVNYANSNPNKTTFRKWLYTIAVSSAYSGTLKERMTSWLNSMCSEYTITTEQLRTIIGTITNKLIETI